jgi:hypothetical protein
MKKLNLLHAFKLYFCNMEFSIIEITTLTEEQALQFNNEVRTNIIKSNYIVARGYYFEKRIVKCNLNKETTKQEPLLLIIPLNEITIHIDINGKQRIDNLFKFYTSNNKEAKELFKSYINYKNEHGLL